MAKIGYAIWTPRVYPHFYEILLGINQEKPNPYLKKEDYSFLLGNFKDWKVEMLDQNPYIKITYDEGELYVFSEGVVLALSDKESNAKKIYDSFSKFAKEIFKLGLPIPSFVAKDIKPIKVTITKRFSKANKKVIYKDNLVELYFNEIKLKDSDLTLVKELVMYVSSLNFCRIIINLHRKIWEDVEKMKEVSKVQVKELITFKKKIEEYLLQLKYLGVRLEQMKCILEKIDASNKSLFKKTITTLEYTKYLWDVTVDYAGATLKHIESLEWALHQHELESIRTFAMLYVIIAIGELVVHPPLSIEKFVIFVFGALLIAFIIHKLISLVSSMLYKFRKHKFSMSRMKESISKLEEEETTLEAFHL